MRRLFVVGMLLAMMLGLSALQAESHGGADPLTLATIGFVVLAAFALAELGGAIGLPKVTGYILAGVILGPFATNIMSANVVGEIRMFNTLALGLIATTAGLELDLGGLRKLARTLAATILIKIVLGVVLVGGVLYLIETSFGVLGLASSAERMAIALVFAALSLGTSPAIALAIISESKAKGRLADLVLGAAIVKDVVVVVCLAIAIATAKALTGGGSLGVDVLIHVSEELGGSILAGSILGGLLIAYLRWIKAEMLLFVAAMVLIVAEVSAALHLELLLVFIVAGLVVRNFSKHEHDLLHPLETVSLPVFIIFFTTAGASVDLGATLSVLPLALAVCGARVVAYIVAGGVGGKVGGESRASRRLAWLGYLPQAGVTLGLIGLGAGQSSETIGPAVATLGMAVVAINLLVGPVTMRVALRNAGEIPSVGESAEDVETAAPRPSRGAAAELEDAGLAAIVSDGVAVGKAESERWVSLVARPALEASTQAMVTGLRALKNARQIGDLLRDLKTRSGRGVPVAGSSLFAALAGVCTDLPEERRVRLEDTHRKIQPRDGRRARLSKRAAALAAFVTFRGSKRTRKVPVRLVARTRLEPEFMSAAAEAQAIAQHFDVELVTVLEDVALGTTTIEEAIRTIESRTPQVIAELERRTGERVESAFGQLARTLAVIDTPALPVSSVRYSSVERELRDGLRELDEDAAAWGERRDAAFATAIVVATVREAQVDTMAAVETRVTAPLERGFFALAEGATTIDRRAGEILAKLETLGDDALTAEIRALLPKPAAKALRGSLAAVRKVPPAPRLVEPLMPELAPRMRLIGDLRALAAAARPAAARILDVSIRERTHARISEQLIGPLDTSIAVARAWLDESDKMVGDVLDLLEFLRRGVADEDGQPASKALTDGLKQASKRLAGVPGEAQTRAQELRASIAAALDASYGSLTEELLGGVQAAQHTQVLRRQDVFRRTRALVAQRTRGWWERASVALQGEASRYRQARRRRFEASRFDPADMREFLMERARSRKRSAGPPGYEQLFSDEPVRDPRLFVAHRPQLESVVQAERTWADDRSAGNAVLVVGSSGSGKSSMLAVGRMKVGLRRSVVLGRRLSGTAAELLPALAQRIGCESTPDAIAAAFTGERTLVAVDDLHTWADGSEQGVAAVQQLLSLIERSSQDAFWILSIDRHAFGVLADIAPLRGWFAQVIELQAVGDDTLEDVMTARHRPTGAELVFPEEGLVTFGTRLRKWGVSERYIAALARRSRRNLRRAIVLWSTSAVAETGGRVRMKPLTEDDVGFLFWPSLDLDALVLLATLLRNGPRTQAQLAFELGADPQRATRLVLTARLASLTDGEYDLIAEARDDVEFALRDAGLIGSSESGV